jgi:nucleoid DNA-binding protein
MNRKQLSIELHSIINSYLKGEATVTLADADNIIVDLKAVIEKELEQGGDLSIPDFGRLSTVYRRAVTKSHPQKAGFMVQIPGKTVVKFKPFTALKNKVSSIAPR